MRHRVLAIGRRRPDGSALRFDWTEEPAEATVGATVVLDEAIEAEADGIGHRIAWLTERGSAAESERLRAIVADNLDALVTSYDWILTADETLADRHPRVRWHPPAHAMPTIARSRYAMYRKERPCSAWHGVEVEGIPTVEHGDEAALATSCFHLIEAERDFRGWYDRSLTACFATGTIPVYRGPPLPDRTFYPRGILLVDDELDPDTLDQERYWTLVRFARRNLGQLRSMPQPADLLFERYLKPAGFVSGATLPPKRKPPQAPDAALLDWLSAAFDARTVRVLGETGHGWSADTEVIRAVDHDLANAPFVGSGARDAIVCIDPAASIRSERSHNLWGSVAQARKVVALGGRPEGRAARLDAMTRLGFRHDGERSREAGALGTRAGLPGLEIFVREALPSAPASKGIGATDPLPPTEPLPVNDMFLCRQQGLDFYLFLDIFVHPDRTHVAAVAPWYHDDWQPALEGVDLEAVTLISGDVEVPGTFVPHRLDSWEPCVLFEFRDPALERRLQQGDRIDFEIRVGPHAKTFELSTLPAPAHDVAMSLVIKNENRWVRSFLEYYLGVLEVDHVWVYDNGTADQETLLALLEPYRRAGQVTYIPWDVRWRNREAPRKMIGQPPQETHSLVRFANSRWIGFLDVDEFLRIPGQTLPAFLETYGDVPVDALSFGLRWFLHQGGESLETVIDPPLTFLSARRDELGRKRQKLLIKGGSMRFARLHWVEEGHSELPVSDEEIFFHHYAIRGYRFEPGRTEAAERDEYMLAFHDRLALDEPRARPKTVDEWKDHIDRALATAEARASGVHPDVFGIKGMSGVYTRHFYNTLCRFAGCRYLEVGSWLGSSLCAAMAGNEMTAVAIENWTQFRGKRDIFMANLERWRGKNTVRFIERDCFEVDPKALGSFDVYMYDGGHSREDHRRALTHFEPCLADPAVVVIDDWNWERVRAGTEDALAQWSLEVLHRREVIDGTLNDADRWWNGIAVLLVGRR
ncbi:MAG: glycosyltransferase family 92 protein [Pseudomonadota bacterium]